VEPGEGAESPPGLPLYFTLQYLLLVGLPPSPNIYHVWLRRTGRRNRAAGKQGFFAKGACLPQAGTSPSGWEVSRSTLLTMVRTMVSFIEPRAPIDAQHCWCTEESAPFSKPAKSVRWPIMSTILSMGASR